MHMIRLPTRAAVNSSVRCREGRAKSSQELCIVANFEPKPLAQDLQELLSQVVPFAGYSSDKDYFAHENPVPWQEAKRPLWAASIGDSCLNTGSQPVAVGHTVGHVAALQPADIGACRSLRDGTLCCAYPRGLTELKIPLKNPRGPSRVTFSRSTVNRHHRVISLDSRTSRLYTVPGSGVVCSAGPDSNARRQCTGRPVDRALASRTHQSKVKVQEALCSLSMMSYCPRNAFGKMPGQH